jgi:hypothetical protein
MRKNFLKVRLAVLSGVSLFLLCGGRVVSPVFCLKPTQQDDLRPRIGGQPLKLVPQPLNFVLFVTFFQNYLIFPEKYVIMLYRGTKKNFVTSHAKMTYDVRTSCLVCQYGV